MEKPSSGILIPLSLFVCSIHLPQKIAEQLNVENSLNMKYKFSFTTEIS